MHRGNSQSTVNLRGKFSECGHLSGLIKIDADRLAFWHYVDPETIGRTVPQNPDAILFMVTFTVGIPDG
jgi:hypothetical protein